MDGKGNGEVYDPTISTFEDIVDFFKRPFFWYILKYKGCQTQGFADPNTAMTEISSITEKKDFSWCVVHVHGLGVGENKFYFFQGYSMGRGPDEADIVPSGPD